MLNMTVRSQSELVEDCEVVMELLIALRAKIEKSIQPVKCQFAPFKNPRLPFASSGNFKNNPGLPLKYKLKQTIY